MGTLALARRSSHSDSRIPWLAETEESSGSQRNNECEENRSLPAGGVPKRIDEDLEAVHRVEPAPGQGVLREALIVEEGSPDAGAEELTLSDELLQSGSPALRLAGYAAIAWTVGGNRAGVQPAHTGVRSTHTQSPILLALK